MATPPLIINSSQTVLGIEIKEMMQRRACVSNIVVIKTSMRLFTCSIYVSTDSYYYPTPKSLMFVKVLQSSSALLLNMLILIQIHLHLHFRNCCSVNVSDLYVQNALLLSTYIKTNISTFGLKTSINNKMQSIRKLFTL